MSDPAERKPQVRKWLADFTRAGGKELYFLFGAGDLFDAPLIVARGADFLEAWTRIWY